MCECALLCVSAADKPSSNADTSCWNVSAYRPSRPLKTNQAELISVTLHPPIRGRVTGLVNAKQMRNLGGEILTTNHDELSFVRQLCLGQSVQLASISGWFRSHHSHFTVIVDVTVLSCLAVSHDQSVRGNYLPNAV